MDSIHETQQNSQLLSAYDAAGLKMVPLRPDTKRPYELEWQHKPYALEDIEQRAANGDSVGLQAGEVSGWLSFVDNDCDEARALASHFLPETLASGKELEAVPSHYAYIAEGSGFMRVSDLKNKPLVEIKASA